jgi:hypothetical protein
MAITLTQIGKSIENEGKYYYSYFFKTAIVSPGVAGKWVDCSQSTGIPKYNAYAGGATEATQLFNSGNAGIFTGANNTTPKYLQRWQAYYTGTAPVPSYLTLCDYLMFYPLIDCDDDTQQDMTNPVSLPRYTDGNGVKMMLVGSVAGIANATVTVTYTNQAGVSGRQSVSTYIIPSATGVICSNSAIAAGNTVSATPFLPLADGDSGVRSVESVQFSTPAGGFCTLVLVKPLASLPVYEASVPSEKTFGPEFFQFPEIKPNAYLNLIAHQGAAQTGQLRCEFLFYNQ